MNRSFRGSSIGLLSGAIASTAFLATLHDGLWSLLLGSAIGVAYCGSLRPTRRAYADNLMSGGSLGVPLWCLISIIAVPLLSRQMPEWSAEQTRQHFPALVGWVVYGALLGIISQALQDGAEYFFGPEPAPKAPAVSVNKRIVILGGGFAGMRLLALELDREDTVSLGRAAELCQTPLAAFMDFAVKHRVPHSGTALRTSNKNPRLLTVSNPGRRNWSPLSC